MNLLNYRKCVFGFIVILPLFFVVLKFKDDPNLIPSYVRRNLNETFNDYYYQSDLSVKDNNLFRKEAKIVYNEDCNASRSFEQWVKKLIDALGYLTWLLLWVKIRIIYDLATLKSNWGIKVFISLY